MKNKIKKRNGSSSGREKSKLNCCDIQSILLDYMTKEIGTAQSSAIREHLRKCTECTAAAAEISKTLSMLQKDDSGKKTPTKLSSRHRKRIFWAAKHPVLDWIYVNHLLISGIVVLIVTVTLLIAACFRIPVILRKEDLPETCTVIISNSPSNFTGNIQQKLGNNSDRKNNK